MLDNKILNLLKGKNAFYSYSFAKFVKKFAREKIDELDKDLTFTAVSEKIVESPDCKYNEVFKDKIEKLSTAKKEWGDSHPDYFRKQVSLPPSYLYKQIFSEYKTEIEVWIDGDVNDPENNPLDNAVQLYKMANEVIKSYDNSDALDKFCVFEKTMINREHIEEQNEFVSLKMKELELPTKEEFIAEHGVKAKAKRLKLNRKPSEMNAECYITMESDFVNMVVASCKTEEDLENMFLGKTI